MRPVGEDDAKDETEGHDRAGKQDNTHCKTPSLSTWNERIASPAIRMCEIPHFQVLRAPRTGGAPKVDPDCCQTPIETRCWPLADAGREKSAELTRMSTSDPESPIGKDI